MSARRILCFGDSNTWGYIPGSGERFPIEIRWPGCLQRLLGPEVLVFEDGLNGRTTRFDDGLLRQKNGAKTLPKSLQKHRPLDFVIVALGINDLKQQFAASVADVSQGAANLLREIQESDCGRSGQPPMALLIAPPPVSLPIADVPERFHKAAAASKAIGVHYRKIAEDRSAMFLDAGDILQASLVDGIHYDAEGHQRLAEAVAACLLPVFQSQTTGSRE